MEAAKDFILYRHIHFMQKQTKSLATFSAGVDECNTHFYELIQKFKCDRRLIQPQFRREFGSIYKGLCILCPSSYEGFSNFQSNAFAIVVNYSH